MSEQTIQPADPGPPSFVAATLDSPERKAFDALCDALDKGATIVFVPSDAEIEAVARVAHEANRAYCASIGDDSQPSWGDAPDWQRKSAVNGVRFHIENPNAGPAASHESWLAEKERDGWRYGPVKDPEKKEHPCFVPYADLPQAQQRKDALFIGVVRALAH